MGYRYVYESVHSSVALRSVKGKERKKTGGFIGTEGVLKHIQEGPPRRRVGLIVEGAPARRKSYHQNSSFLPSLIHPLDGAQILESPTLSEAIGTFLAISSSLVYLFIRTLTLLP